MPKIFVYGTLINNMNSFVQEAKLIADDVKVVGYQMYNMGWFPGVIRSYDPNDAVYGQVWEIPVEGFQRLDQYEGYYVDDPDASLYIRNRFDRREVISSTELPKGPIEFYYYNGRAAIPPDRRIVSGRWKDAS